MKHSARVFLGLGSNVGDRCARLRSAVSALSRPPEIRFIRLSPIFQTSSVGPKQKDFLNAAVEVRTTLTPQELLRAVKAMERRLGRRRRKRWGPREIDIDILFYGGQRLRAKTLVIPHPRLAQRKFALWPLAAIAPRFRDPVSGKTLARLRRELTDPGQSIRLFK
jgi:2-amino-4-hydroxy-6-hydroxymethyldihydropteridine diphosphokinase